VQKVGTGGDDMKAHGGIKFKKRTQTRLKMPTVSWGWTAASGHEFTLHFTTAVDTSLEEPDRLVVNMSREEAQDMATRIQNMLDEHPEK
jgi:ribose 1,5-bisphosphokinase PhnN